MYLLLTQCFPSRLGGIESLVSNLALSISKYNKVVVFADQYHLLYDTIYDNKYKDKILIKRFSGIKYFRRRKKTKEIKFFIESTKVKYIIADTWKSLELCIDFINKKNITVMCLAHGNELLSNNLNKKERIISTLNKVPLIVANSNYTATLVKQLIGNKNNISVVYPGANNLCSLKPDISLKIEGKPVLLTLARLEKRKGHALILEAIKKLKENFPNIKYLIAGEGNLKFELKKIVDKYNINLNVQFISNVNEHQKKQLFNHTSLMIMPTLDESYKRSIEGFGISYIEAAFFGIPSIVSNVGGTPEAVLHEKTGIVIDDQNQLFRVINDLLSNKDKLKQLGDRAKKRAEKSFKWDNVVNKYLSVFK